MRILLLYILLSTFIYANSYALIIGTNKNGLQGAINDVNAIAKVLDFQGVQNIKLLKNREATKDNILNNIKLIANRLNPNDRFYLFFSGHGTSLLDPNFAKVIDNDKRLITLLENSGGLIPWDFDKGRAYKTIISAKRDLAPIFNYIDKKKKAFTMVMIDACFSGMSYRDMNYNQHKQMPIDAKPHFGDSYPYKNLVYLASTAMSDWATEDKRHRPIRGYFSRALEHCLYSKNGLRDLENCMDNVPMPQSTEVYPKYRDVPTLFTHHRVSNGHKSIIRASSSKSSIDKLLKLATSTGSIKIFTTQKNGIRRKVYTPNTLLNLQIATKQDGYLVLFNFTPDKKLKLYYPKYEPREIRADNIESFGEFSASEPFGEEYMIAFLVKRAVAEKFIEIYKRNQGNLEGDSSIREVIGLLRDSDGSSLRLISTR